jgi:hypothetical protein
MRDKWARLAPWTGVAAVAFIVAAFAVGGESPDSGDSGREVLRFYADNEGSQFAAAILLAYGSILLIFFAGALSALVRRTDPGSGALSRLVVAGGALEALGLAIFASFAFALADAHDKIGPDAAQALNVLSQDFFLPLVVGVAVLMFSSAVAILRNAALPRWLGWAAVVIGVAAVTPIGFFGFLATGLWILAASIYMLRAPATESPAAAPTTAP